VNYLKGKKILITKSEEDCGTVFNNLTAMGAEFIYFPTIKILPVYNSLDLSGLVSNSDHFDYIVFTSPNAVDVFSKLVDEYKPDLTRTKVAVVGSSTAESCRAHGIYIHIIPEEFSVRGLIKKFSEINLSEEKILIPGSSISGYELMNGLTNLGASVIKMNIYDTVYNEQDDLKNEINIILNSKPDLFAFTSPSSFNGFIKILNLENYHNYFQGSVICAIGITTEDAIKNLGVTVNIVPNTFSLRGIAEAINTFYSTTFNIA
jgi:uroporphyrinogen-III synthase